MLQINILGNLAPGDIVTKKYDGNLTLMASELQ